MKKLVDKALKALGADCYRFMPVQSGFGAKTLDYLLCIKGHFVAIETKGGLGKAPTPLQYQTIQQIVNAGGKVFVVYDENSLTQAMAHIALMMEFDNGPHYPRDAGAPLTTSVSSKRPQA